jgi:G:T-mismatch repair DNA endonuclease (very short patch repair protein)
VIQVHGCFWHGHDCRRGRAPSINRGYWRSKIDRNRRRDESVKRRLRGLGWHVLTLWECRLKEWGPEKLARTLKHLKARGAPGARVDQSSRFLSASRTTRAIARDSRGGTAFPI